MTTMNEIDGRAEAVRRPPEDVAGGLFATGRRVARTHPLMCDEALASALLVFSTIWLVGSPYSSVRAGIVQAALVMTVVFRRRWPVAAFVAASAIALAQWVLGFPLIGDAALLIALYTVAAHERRSRVVLATVVLEGGAVMAAFKWDSAGTVPRSLFFLTATVVAAFFAGLTVASGSRYMAWLDERARRLEVERDQQAAIAASAERTRIARELHDIVSHSLSVVITLADGAALVTRSDPVRGADAMADVADVGRQALADMRSMLGVLRTDGPQVELTPQPGVAQLDMLVERARSTGLRVDMDVEGTPFPIGAAGELSVYRIVQEALTNTVRHAAAHRAWVVLRYDAPKVHVRVADDGTGLPKGTIEGGGGHGIQGMRERAALHRGSLHAGPEPGGGWLVSAWLRLGNSSGLAVREVTGGTVPAPAGPEPAGPEPAGLASVPVVAVGA